MATSPAKIAKSSNRGSKPGERRGGRQKGTPNKITAAAKDAIAQAAERLGGIDRIVEWAGEDPKNESVFWSTIYPKLIPVQLSGEGGGPIQQALTVKFVD